MKINRYRPFFKAYFREKNSILYALLLLIFTLICFDLNLKNAVYDDHFHHGEYFNIFNNIRIGATLPLSVHGAVDYIPAWLAFNIAGPDYYAHITRIIYISFKVIACILFLLTLERINQKLIPLLCAALLAPFILDHRDFSLSILIYAFISLNKYKADNLKYIFVLALISFAAVFNLFYATNRGFAGMLAILLALMISAYFDKRNFLGLFLIALLLLLIDKWIPVFSVKDLIEKIPFLIKNSRQWSFAWEYKTISLAIYIFLLLAISIFLNVYAIIQKKNNHKELAILAFISILSVFHYQIATYRADLFHIMMAFPIILLSLFNFLRLTTDEKINLSSPFVILILMFSLVSLYIIQEKPLVILISLFLLNELNFTAEYKFQKYIHHTLRAILILICILLPARILIQYNTGDYNWVKTNALSKKNEEIMDSSILWAQNKINDGNTVCLFDLSNSGLINVDITIPTCTKYSYLAFSDHSNKNELIEFLNSEKAPQKIVLSSNGKNSEIEKNQENQLNLLIKTKYPYEECESKFCIRYQ